LIQFQLLLDSLIGESFNKIKFQSIKVKKSLLTRIRIGTMERENEMMKNSQMKVLK